MGQNHLPPPRHDCARTAEHERLAALPARTFWSSAAGMVRHGAVNAVTAGIAGHPVAVAHAAMALITGAPALCPNCEYGLNLVTMQDNYALGPDSPDLTAQRAARRPDPGPRARGRLPRPLALGATSFTVTTSKGRVFSPGTAYRRPDRPKD